MKKMEIYSVDSVVARGTGSDKEIEFARFYDLRAATQTKQPPGGYWYESRSAPDRAKRITGVKLS